MIHLVRRRTMLTAVKPLKKISVLFPACLAIFVVLAPGITIAQTNYGPDSGAEGASLQSLEDAGNFDQIAGASAFSIAGGLIGLSNSISESSASYQIFGFAFDSAASTLHFVNYDAGYLPSPSDSGTLTFFAAVPEPSSGAGLFVTSTALALLIRKPRRALCR